MPLTAPQLAADNTEDGADTNLVFNCYQPRDNTFEFTAMNTQWGDYCGGFSYEVIYVDGEFSEAPTQDEVNAVFSATGATTITVTTSDFTWVGIHTIKIRGTNGGGSEKEYNTIDSDEFTIEFINPCTISIIEVFDLEDMLTSINVGTNVT